MHQIPQHYGHPCDNIERERLTRRSKHYVLVEGKLYHKNAKGELLQKCVSIEEGKKILKEIHIGTCSNHAASRTLVGKPSELVSIGLQLLPMLRHSFAGVRIVSFLLSKSTYWPRPYK